MVTSESTKQPITLAPTHRGSNAKCQGLGFKDRRDNPLEYKLTNDLKVGIHSFTSKSLSKRGRRRMCKGISASQYPGQRTPSADSGG